MEKYLMMNLFSGADKDDFTIRKACALLFFIFLLSKLSVLFQGPKVETQVGTSGKEEREGIIFPSKKALFSFAQTTTHQKHLKKKETTIYHNHLQGIES